MITPARLQVTLELLAQVGGSDRPADGVVAAVFRARRDLREGDRAAILELFYEVLRHHARLGWWLARYERPATPRLRLFAWLALSRRMTREQLQLTFALTESERDLLKRLQGGSPDHPAMPDGVRLECPDWALEPLRARFGAAFEAEMAALLAPPPLDLRINPLKTTREAMLADLRRLGFKADPCPLSPDGVRLPRRPSLARLPMLQTGEAEIQDEGSQLIARLLGVRPGERVVDFCAGAGGKTLALAAAMQNRGQVIACDVSEGRLKRAAERFRRAGLHNIQTRLLASETDRWVKRHKGGYDRVLVDAPCSGTGAWRRNPDARWRGDAEGFAALLPLQAAILASDARLVRLGGRLVYATCSLIPAENEAQVAAFLAAHPDFRIVPQEVVPDSADPDCLSLTPARHGTDGFFAAALERVTSGSERPSS